MLDRLRARLGNVRERAREALRPGPPAGERGPAGHAPGSPSQEGPRDSGGGGFHPPQRPPVHVSAAPTGVAAPRAGSAPSPDATPAAAPAAVEVVAPVAVAAPIEATVAARVAVATPVPAPVAAPVAVEVVAPVAVAAPSPAAPPRVLYADTSSTDIGSYRARAVAAGRDPAQIAGGEGRNVAGDGIAYWGPLDNESARAKAAGRVLTINPRDCISCGTCVEQTEAVFELPDDATAIPVAQDGPMDLIQDAIDACPVTCIHWVTDEEARAQELTTGR